MDENGPFIIDFPTKIVIYHSYASHYQRVRHLLVELHPPKWWMCKNKQTQKITAWSLWVQKSSKESWILSHFHWMFMFHAHRVAGLAYEYTGLCLGMESPEIDDSQSWQMAGFRHISNYIIYSMFRQTNPKMSCGWFHWPRIFSHLSKYVPPSWDSKISQW